MYTGMAAQHLVMFIIDWEVHFRFCGIYFSVVDWYVNVFNKALYRNQYFYLQKRCFEHLWIFFAVCTITSNQIHVLSFSSHFYCAGFEWLLLRVLCRFPTTAMQWLWHGIQVSWNKRHHTLNDCDWILLSFTEKRKMNLIEMMDITCRRLPSKLKSHLILPVSVCLFLVITSSSHTFLSWSVLCNGSDTLSLSVHLSSLLISGVPLHQNWNIHM